MAARSIFANLVRGDDGSFSTAYGSFVLHSALQPIFRSSPETGLNIEAVEGLVRASRNNEPVSPAEFFPLVDRGDMAMIDSILRTIHILNTGALNRTQTRIFVKFHPGLFRTPNEMRQEVEHIKLAGHEAGLKPDRIVCEISEKSGEDSHLVVAFAEHMRGMGFRIAIDDYGAGDSDLEQLKLIRPDYVKFEAAWIRDFIDNSAGFALLRVIVGQLVDDGIEPIFEGLEETWQVDLCEQLGVPLIQGFALARPQLAPTNFNLLFPEFVPGLAPAMQRSGDAAVRPGRSMLPLAPVGLARPTRAFGRRRTE